MIVIEQQQPTPTALAGILHTTLAGTDEGLTRLSVWRQSMASGAATPPHRHDCDEVVLCESGSGEVWIDGIAHPFCTGSTIILPRDKMHQLVNSGNTPMETVAIFAATPVITRLPGGELIDLPWRT